LEGWFSRATPLSDNFSPSRDKLAFSVLRNAPVDPEGFTLALFYPNLAVDATGRVLVLSDTDFSGLVNLAKRTPDLPQTGSFMNTWRIRQDRTSQPIDRLFVPVNDELVQTSVQGWERGKKELVTPVGDITELPDVLYDFFGLALEARQGYEKSREDQDVIGQVKAVVGPVI